MPQNHIKKGMILCAGLGTRLLPITNKVPKPLVPVLNIANVLHTVRLLEEAGISEIIVNLHHLPEAMKAFFKSFKLKKSTVSFSEEKVLLGTGGGVKKAASFFGNSAFILANCDFVTNLDIVGFIELHKARKSLASMLLIQDPSRQMHYSKVGVDEFSKLCSLPRLETKVPTATGIFTGIHAIEPECLDFLEERPSGINEILYPKLMKEYAERVYGFFAEKGYWYDTGEVPSFLYSTNCLLNELREGSFLLETIKNYGDAYHEVQPYVWTSHSQKIPTTVQLRGPVVIGKNVRFNGQIVLGPNTVVGDETVIDGPVEISGSVLLPHSKVQGHRILKDVLFFESVPLS